MQLFYYVTKKKKCVFANSFCNLPLPGHLSIPLDLMLDRFQPISVSFSSHFTYVRVCRLLLFFSHPVVSDSLQPHGLQHSRPPCPSPSSGVCPSSRSLHQRCHPAISSSDALFFCPQSFPASGTFPVSWLFTSDDQTTGASSLASVLPTSIQGWFLLRLNDLISLLSEGL